MGRALSGADIITLAAGAPGMPNDALHTFESSEIGRGFVFVLAFSETASPKHKLRARLVGGQFGARFGHSVLLMDLNKDG